MTNAALKAQIDSQITNETTANAITPTDVGTNLKAVVDFINYNSFAALVSQTGTGAPTLKVLNNTTGVTFTTSYLSTGMFYLTASANIATFTKTATIYIYNSFGSFPNGGMNLYIDGANSFLIETRDSGTLTNGVISDAFIEIRIYN
jgi:hypothetical protein